MKTAQVKSTQESAHHGINNTNKQAFFSNGHVQDSSFFSPVTVQPKLKIGSASDKFEQQADRVAGSVVNFSPPGVQKKCSACEKEESLQRKSNTAQAAGTAPNSVAQKIQNTSDGKQLPDSVNSEMSQKIGANFSNVQIHTGPDASHLSRSLGARAFTYKNNIFFDSGEYDPNSRYGKWLLAHELTHVVQQQATADRVDTGQYQNRNNSPDYVSLMKSPAGQLSMYSEFMINKSDWGCSIEYLALYTSVTAAVATCGSAILTLLAPEPSVSKLAAVLLGAGCAASLLSVIGAVAALIKCKEQQDADREELERWRRIERRLRELEEEARSRTE